MSKFNNISRKASRALTISICSLQLYSYLTKSDITSGDLDHNSIVSYPVGLNLSDHYATVKRLLCPFVNVKVQISGKLSLW